MLIEYSALAGAFDVLATAATAYEDSEIGGVLAGRGLPTDMIEFEAERANWVGLQFRASSPVALKANHQRSSIAIRSGMSSQLHDSLLTPCVWHEPGRLMGMLDGGLKPLKKDRSDERALRCSIQFGDAFIADFSITDPARRDGIARQRAVAETGTGAAAFSLAGGFFSARTSARRASIRFWRRYSLNSRLFILKSF
jgi:hypothetical protein